MKLEPIVCPNCGGRVNRAIMTGGIGCQYQSRGEVTVYANR